MPPLAPRMTRFKPSASTEASARARALISAGRDIVDLSIGEPDFPTPDNVKDAVARAMANNETHYTNTGGTPAVNAAVRQKFLRDNRLDFAQDEVMASAGAKHAMFNAFMCTVSRGDEVIVPSPYWISYPNQVELAGGTPVIVECGAEDGYKLRAAALGRAITDKTRWLVLNSPNNPTGVVYAEETVNGIARACREYDLWCISDEVYDTQVWEGAHISPRTAEGMVERTLVVGSMSKSHAMTGSRVGWVAGPAEVVEHIINLSTHTTYGVPGYIQDAATFALNEGPGLEKEVGAPFERRREIGKRLVEAQNLVKLVPSGGAMYLMLDIRATGLSGEEFANQLLDAHHIAVMPGESFGEAAAGHVRVAMTVDDEAFERALSTVLSFAKEMTP